MRGPDATGCKDVIVRGGELLDLFGDELEFVRNDGNPGDADAQSAKPLRHEVRVGVLREDRMDIGKRD